MSDPTGPTGPSHEPSRLDAMFGGESSGDRDRRTAPAGRWLPIVVAAVVATVLVIGGVAWLANRDSDPPASTPGGASQTPEPAPGRTAEVEVYYVGQTATGPRLFREKHSVEDATGDDVAVAVAEAVGAKPLDPDYSRWTVGAPEATARSNGQTVTVDFSAQVPRPDGMSEQEAVAAVQAVVWTAGAAISDPVPVTFTVRGTPTDDVLGVDTAEPVARQNADDILAGVSISSPTQGETVSSGFTVRGEAATFEANVVWELKQGDTVVKDGFTTAQECCTLSPYSFTVDAPPGDYTLHVHDTDESDGEGVGTSEDTKDITVR